MRDNNHVGKLRHKIQLEVIVIGVYPLEEVNKNTQIIRLRDTAGNFLVWLKDDDSLLERGNHLDITGIVKEHDEYRGVKQTVLTRCKYTKFKVMTANEAAQMEAIA